MYGLSTLDYYALEAKLDFVILMAPCMLVNRDESMLHLTSKWDYYFMINLADVLGLDNHIFGPDSEALDFVENMAVEMSEKFFENSDVKPDAMPIKSMKHYSQNALVGRFQEFVPCFGMPLCKEKRKELNLESIEKV